MKVKKNINSSPADLEQKFNESEKGDEATIPQADKEIKIHFKDQDRIYGVDK